MSDIFDKLEKNISENKNKAKEKKDQTDKLWIKYASEQEKIRKEGPASMVSTAPNSTTRIPSSWC